MDIIEFKNTPVYRGVFFITERLRAKSGKELMRKWPLKPLPMRTAPEKSMTNNSAGFLTDYWV
jgi:hypothetical protein